jgi:hypothetical protein
LRVRATAILGPVKRWRILCALLACGALVIGAGPAVAANVVEYVYDAAGNITQVVRRSTSGLAITALDPGSGAVGTTVTILGSGFSPTPAGNTVRFNGTPATVAASNIGSISTTVPAGATTGRVTVAVGAATATSAQDFVVVVPGAPTITAFSPLAGAAGTVVSVAGTNFETAAGATTVRLNGVTAAATVSDAGALTFTVPAAASSGRITATTSIGTGTSASDFIVAPSGISAADIATVVRLPADGSSAALAISVANKHGVLLFDGEAGAFHTLQFSLFATSPTNATISYKVVSPDGSQLAAGTVGNASRPTIHLPKLPAMGTYSVFVSVGSATLSAQARLVADPVISAGGLAAATALDFAGQSARFVFEAAASQRLGVGVMGVAVTPAGAGNVSFTAYQPNGSALYAPTAPSCANASTQNPQGNCDGELFTTVAGTHTLVASSPPTGYANFSVQLNGEATGSLAADAPADVVLDRVGQDARFTISATAGDSLGVDLSGINPQPQAQTFSAMVHKPDGVSLGSCMALPPQGAYCELGAVPATGSYSVWIDPSFGAHGSLKLTLKQGAMLSTADLPTAFAASAIAESARFRFAATAGQSFSVGLTGLAYVGSSSSSSYLSVYRPDRTAVGSAVSCSPTVGGGTCKATLTNLPQSGTYSLVVVSPGGVKAAGNINLSADLSGALVPGTPVALAAARPGQNARYTFAGTAGESTSIKVYGVITSPEGQTIQVKIYRPDGALLTSANATSAASAVLSFASLPSTGTYSVLLEPFYGATWQAQVALDPGVGLDVNGAMATLGAAVAGEPLRYRFSGTAGQRLHVGLAGLAYTAPSTSATTLSILRPDGVSLGSVSCYTSGSGACEWSSTGLPASGTYSLTVTPPGTSILAGGTLALSTPLAGTLVIGDPAQAVEIARPGQTARYTFAGTAAQLLRLNWTGTAVSGGATVAVSVLKPDGSTLGSGSFGNGATGGLDIASLPSTGTYTIVFDPASAGTMLAPVSLVTR